jgi:phage gp46-like protein
MLYKGDHFIDARGLPVVVEGPRELIQRALIRLQVQKGSFPQDRELGSDLYKLRRSGSEDNTRKAMSYVREALAPIPELSVERVKLTPVGVTELLVEVNVRIEGVYYQLEVKTL